MSERRKNNEVRASRKESTKKREKSKAEPKKADIKNYVSFGVVIICICVGLFAGLNLITGNIRLRELKQIEAQKEAEIKENEIQIKELQEIKKSGNTDEYVIKVAREKLGLAFSDEKVYKDRD